MPPPSNRWDPLMPLGRHQGTPAVLQPQTNLLLLADSRLPAGGHAHSGGLEPAAAAGVVTGLADLADFLRGRLATAGLSAAALAAAACAHATLTADTGTRPPAEEGDGAAATDGPTAPRHDHAATSVSGGRTGASPAAEPRPPTGDDKDGWLRLDAEADARMPSPAGRHASRAQGRALLRAARTAWPHPALDALAAAHGRHGASHADRSARPSEHGPHHPVVLGAATAAAGGAPEQAAMICAYGSVTGPASAAVRLLGLDPLAVHRVLADLAPQVDAVAVAAAVSAGGDWAALPATSAPALDLFAELHLRSEMRLFES
jgi:urease accessory protein